MPRPAVPTCVLLVGALSCGVGDGAQDPPNGGSASDSRGPLGKADDNGSCGTTSANSCGGQSSDGCWCDEACEGFGDCCSDRAEVCLDAGGASTGAAPLPEPTAGSTGDSATPETCAKNVVLMGYWPPTNEMLRAWSDDPAQNPDGWQGEDWRGLGYDVYAFFPEFPPDGDPTNDDIGEDGAVGSPDFDLRVDYQATSADFWRIVDELDPILLVTTSRGGQIGWEVEAIEGGHGEPGERDPARDWRSDGHGDVLFPTEATVDPRSWAAISEFRAGNILASALPMDAIVAATAALDITSVQIDETGTSGNFLSGFLGLHGIAYHEQHAHNLAAGHIHVGFGMPADTARMLMEATVEALLQAHPAAEAACP
jgi:hypothetical protein